VRITHTDLCAGVLLLAIALGVLESACPPLYGESRGHSIFWGCLIIALGMVPLAVTVLHRPQDIAVAIGTPAAAGFAVRGLARLLKWPRNTRTGRREQRGKQ
jgi:hypothetical protein